MDLEKARKWMMEQFGSREGYLGYQLIHLSMTGQPTDITFFKREPMLDVVVDPQLNLALAYGAGVQKLSQKLQSIALSNGETISVAEIWTINPMPHDGISEAKLAAVDLAEGEEQAGPQGETVREMIRATYHCKSREEEDAYLRRFIAS